MFFFSIRNDRQPVEDVDISETSDDQCDGSVEGGDKVVVTNSQEADQPDFVYRAEITMIIPNFAYFYN